MKDGNRSRDYINFPTLTHGYIVSNTKTSSVSSPCLLYTTSNPTYLFRNYARPLHWSDVPVGLYTTNKNCIISQQSFSVRKSHVGSIHCFAGVSTCSEIDASTIEGPTKDNSLLY